MPSGRPQQRTRRKRTAAVVLLLLAAGTIANVTVAWQLHGRGGFGDGTRLLYPRYLHISAYRVDTIGYTRFQQLARPMEFRSRIVPPNEQEVATLEETVPRRIRSPDGQPLQKHYEVAGLPLRAIDASDFRRRLDVTYLVNTFEIIVGRTTLRRNVRVPYVPMWPGFAINTLFYALLLWLIFFAPFAARRLLRRRRGLCEKCAYPVGVSPVCTECGAAVARNEPRA